MSYMKMLQAKHKQTLAKAEDILDRAEAEGRSTLTPAEQEQYDELLDTMKNQKIMMQRAFDRVANQEEARQMAHDTLGLNGTENRDNPDGQNTERRWLPTLSEYRDLTTTTGAALIPQSNLGYYFDMLRPQTALLAAGPQIIPVSGAGKLVIPKVTAQITVGGVAEAAPIPESDPGVDHIDMVPIAVKALTQVSREAIEDSDNKLINLVENSLIRDTATALDRSFMVGNQEKDANGTVVNMLGLLNLPGVTTLSNGTNGASLSATTGYGTLANMVAAYESTGADTSTAAFLMHPRTWGSIRSITDSQGRPIFGIDPAANLKRSIFGIPVYLSGALPTNQTVGTSTDCSTMFLADMSRIVVGQWRQVEVQMSTEAFFRTDEYGLRVTARYNVACTHPQTIVRVGGVRA